MVTIVVVVVGRLSFDVAIAVAVIVVFFAGRLSFDVAVPVFGVV